jgi:hypothetical protein
MSDYGETYICCHAPDYEKDPNSTEDYTFGWAVPLNDDTIQTSTFLLPDGLTRISETNTSTTATIMVSGGACGRTYRITHRITTAAGRQFDQTIRILITEQ